MATLIKQRIDARITFGDFDLEVCDIVSFNVQRARNKMAADFNASVKIPITDVNSSVIDSKIVIRAGVIGNLKTIFTGRIEKCVINPIRTDASKVMLNISGRDVMAVMEGQNINRRVKTYRDGTAPPERWGVINSVLKHNTSRVEKFKPRIINEKPKATGKLPIFPVYETPDAFRIKNDIKREDSGIVYGSIEATRVIE